MNIYSTYILNQNSNHEKPSIVKLDEHIPCEYSLSTIWTLDIIENKYDIYKGEDCMKKFCKSLREH